MTSRELPRPAAPSLAELRRRNSEKWRTYPDDVLPLFVAEMDYPIAPVVANAMRTQIETSDLGYAGTTGSVGPAFSGFAERHWGWRVDPDDVHLTTDVSVVIVEALRAAISPGDRVIITPPVYPPFFELIPEAGGRLHQVPLVADSTRPTGYRLDLDAIGAEFAAGTRAILLCHPHNPLGLVHPREDLIALAEMADDHGAVVVSDEIHAPLVHPPDITPEAPPFVPFLSVSGAARKVGIAAHSASKAFNIAGTKCALTVVGSDLMRAVVRRQPHEVAFRTSILGRAASAAAYTHGDDYLAATLNTIADSLDLLEQLLAQHLPQIRYTRPHASYLAWLDFGDTGLGDDPAEPILDEGRVALHRGPAFGDQGKGFARINVACSPEVLTEAIERIARVVDAHGQN